MDEKRSEGRRRRSKRNEWQEAHREWVRGRERM